MHLRRTFYHDRCPDERIACRILYLSMEGVGGRCPARVLSVRRNGRCRTGRCGGRFRLLQVDDVVDDSVCDTCMCKETVKDKVYRQVMDGDGVHQLPAQLVAVKEAVASLRFDALHDGLQRRTVRRQRHLCSDCLYTDQQEGAHTDYKNRISTETVRFHHTSRQQACRFFPR